MEKLKGFPAFGSHTIALSIDLEDGEGNTQSLPVEHIFNEPTAQSKKDYFGTLAANQSTDETGVVMVTQGDLTLASEVIWNATIQDVKGYVFAGGKKPKNWKDLIPVEHKRWACERLIKNVGQLSKVAEKN